MKKLIHFPENKIAPTGGPAGYLHNLRKGLYAIGDVDSIFLPAQSTEIRSKQFFRQLVPRRIVSALRLRKLLTLPHASEDPAVDYGLYEAIHFHSTEDLYLHRKALDCYKGRVVLTSHSPCVYHRELISRLDQRDSESHSRQLASLAVIDEYAFRRADCVIFPCPESEEPYFHTWSEYANVRDEGKLLYLPTGIERCHAVISRDRIRERYGIPADAFVICYVGRHNVVKGYGDLVSFAPDILSNQATWLLAAGKPGRIAKPQHPHWIETGWTNDPHSIIAAADVLLLPNRETYFDLILLEALSLGQVILATRTGGNKYFEQFGSMGIRLYDSKTDLLVELNRLQAASERDKADWRIANRAIFDKHFNLTAFAKRYVRLMDEVCNG